MATPDKEVLMAKVPKLTREQFELRLINIETCYQLAFESAKALNVLECSPRDISRQRRMNTMIDLQICALIDESGITVDVSSEERPGRVPFPPKIAHDLTMLNYDNNR